MFPDCVVQPLNRCLGNAPFLHPVKREPSPGLNLGDGTGICPKLSLLLGVANKVVKLVNVGRGNYLAFDLVQAVLTPVASKSGTESPTTPARCIMVSNSSSAPRTSDSASLRFFSSSRRGLVRASPSFAYPRRGIELRPGASESGGDADAVGSGGGGGLGRQGLC